jgi:hypothetical protein
MTEFCFQCKEKFEAPSTHLQAWTDSGLCPKCYGKAMEELHNPSVGFLKEINTNLTLGNQLLSKIIKESGLAKELLKHNIKLIKLYGRA